MVGTRAGYWYLGHLSGGGNNGAVEGAGDAKEREIRHAALPLSDLWLRCRVNLTDRSTNEFLGPCMGFEAGLKTGVASRGGRSMMLLNRSDGGSGGEDGRALSKRYAMLEAEAAMQGCRPLAIGVKCGACSVDTVSGGGGICTQCTETRWFGLVLVVRAL